LTRQLDSAGAGHPRSEVRWQLSDKHRHSSLGVVGVADHLTPHAFADNITTVLAGIDSRNVIAVRESSTCAKAQRRVADGKS
jgi:hypothetical protein